MLRSIHYSGLVMATILFSCGAGSVSAESLSAQDQEEILRLQSMRGMAGDEVNQLIDQVRKAGEKGFPIEPLANKVKEGLAKGVEPKRIDPVLRQMVGHFESAQELLRETGGRGVAEGNRQRAMELMADAFSRGATADEIRELARVNQDNKQKVTQESLAAGAKSLAVMKESRISSKDGTALVSEGLKQGYRPSELLDLSREVKQRGAQFRENRANMQSLRDRIGRGERGSQLFHEEHGGVADGDHSNRSRMGEAMRDRSGRSNRIEHGEHNEHIERPGPVERFGGGDRGGRDH